MIHHSFAEIQIRIVETFPFRKCCIWRVFRQYEFFRVFSSPYLTKNGSKYKNLKLNELLTLNTASQYLQIFCLIGDTSDPVSDDSFVDILKFLSDENEGLSVSFKSISV